MNKKEIMAIILGAVLIFAPLYAGETQNFVHADGQTSGAQTPNPTEILAWLGFGVLLFQAWIAFRQTDISREQNDILAKQTLIQTETNRPHVFVLGINVIQEGNGWVRLDAIWKNSGLTPPINLNIAMQLDWIAGTAFPKEYPLSTSFRRNVPLGVGQEVIFESVMIKESDLIAGSNAHGNWYVWGKANYIDNFSPNVIHRVEYCFRMTNHNGRATFTQSYPHNRTYDEKN